MDHQPVRANVRFAFFFHRSHINPRNGTLAADRLANNKLRQFPRTGPLLKDLDECFQRPKGNSDTHNCVQSFLGGHRKPYMQCVRDEAAGFQNLNV